MMLGIGNELYLHIFTDIILTNSMELSPSRKAASCSATTKLPSILRNPKTHQRVQNNLPLIPILNQSNPTHTTHPISLRSILIFFTHLRIGLLSALFLSDFPTNNLYAFFFYPIRAICPVHLNIFDLITLILLATVIMLLFQLLNVPLLPIHAMERVSQRAQRLSTMQITKTEDRLCYWIRYQRLANSKRYLHVGLGSLNMW
jgi:hypothetical protein